MSRSLTTKQMFLMSVIVKGNSDNSHVDMDQILERLSYATTKQSLQHSLKALIKKEYIKRSTNMEQRAKRRGAWRTLVWPTQLGMEVFTPYLPTVIAEEERLRNEAAMQGGRVAAVAA